MNAFAEQVALTTRTTGLCHRGLVEGGCRFIAKNLVDEEKVCTFANGRKDLETGLSITFVKRVTNKTVMNIVLVIRSVIPVVT